TKKYIAILHRAIFPAVIQYPAADRRWGHHIYGFPSFCRPFFGFAPQFLTHDSYFLTRFNITLIFHLQEIYCKKKLDMVSLST
ncbi:MAG: hypothetical protein IKK22_06330, partial [Firmicutes bacterium]|nr:hypothetical protein [Bacillota bacterium]